MISSVFVDRPRLAIVIAIFALFQFVTLGGPKDNCRKAHRSNTRRQSSACAQGKTTVVYTNDTLSATRGETCIQLGKELRTLRDRAGQEATVRSAGI